MPFCVYGWHREPTLNRLQGKAECSQCRPTKIGINPIRSFQLVVRTYRQTYIQSERYTPAASLHVQHGRVYFKDFVGLHNTPLPSPSLPSPPVSSPPIPTPPFPSPSIPSFPSPTLRSRLP